MPLLPQLPPRCRRRRPGRGFTLIEPECQTEARKTVRFVVAGSLRIEAVGADVTPAMFGVPTWTESGERFVDWSCAVTPGPDGAWLGRLGLQAGAGGDADQRRMCRIGIGIDGEGSGWAAVRASLRAQNLLIVGAN